MFIYLLLLYVQCFLALLHTHLRYKRFILTERLKQQRLCHEGALLALETPSRNEWFMAGLLYSSNLLSRSCHGSTDLLDTKYERRDSDICNVYFILLHVSFKDIPSMQGQCVAALFKQLRWWRWRWSTVKMKMEHFKVTLTLTGLCKNQNVISCHCCFKIDKTQ